MNSKKQQIDEASRTALIAVLDALKELAPGERRRVMRAVAAFLRTRGKHEDDEDEADDEEENE